MGKSQSKQPISEVKDGNYVCFALVGQSGCGKSAFVNAVRGIDDEDEHAASVDIVDTGQQPTEYIYPSNPNVSFCDLPGYGTPSYPDVETYWRELQLEKFGIFLIFISNRVTELDVAIIRKVKSINKSFFLIRPKIDFECMTKEHKPHVKEEEILLKIKDYMVKQTSHLSCTKEDIFLISNYDPYNKKWDFFQLIQAIINMMPDPEINTTSDLTEQYLADTRTYVKQNGVDGIVEFLKKKLEGSKEVNIRFAITGDSGTGKSAFINAIRGLKDDDDGAAKVNVIETTREPTEYQHPDNPKISFVDLPGIGTPNYPDLATYSEKVGLEDYDTFLIFTAGRFTQNDLELAEKVKSIGKSFFLIRTKVDIDSMPRVGRSINEPQILERIRQNCMNNVKGLISSEKEIFLISNYDKDKWDFDCLIEAISGALHFPQRECLTLSLSNVTRECLNRKAKSFKAQAVLVAAASASTGAIPIPGMTCVIDVPLIERTMMAYYRQFGLHNITPEELVLLDKTVKGSAGELVAKFSSTTATKAVGVDEVSKFIPIIGTAIAGSKSFAMTLGYLTRSINEMKKAAFAVWDNAEKKSIKIHDSTLSVESHRESEVSAESWKWEETSIIHREKFIKLREFGKIHPEEIKEVNGVRVCCSEEFLIGKGADGTRVYVGLGKDGYERAVKRLPRDACSGLAEQEKKILNELNIMKSNYTVRYWYLDEQSDKHYLFLILDLCEETLEHFVGHSSPDDLLRCAPLVIRQILKGLADLHRDPTPILHRDLKPTNIMRNVQGNWLLADFGISRILTRGASTHPSNQRGTEDWRAVESYPSKIMTDDGKARYKKESDIQVSGNVAFYIVTKGEHPFGSKPDRLRNLLDGKSVGLDTLKDPVLKDLLSWMLSLDPKDRPSAKEALKHPYLQHVKQQFKMLCQMGNQQEIKARDWNSPVVQKLNKDPTDWRTLMKPDVLKYLCAGFMNGKPKIFHYKPSWTECLRLMRNVNEHWHEQYRPLPQPEPFYEVGDPQKYFLNLFPNLPVEVHRIVRSCDWKERPDLKEYFI